MKLSIIIPTYNEARSLPSLLEQIRTLDISPAQKEIIIVDDGSTDGTAQILRTSAAGMRVLTHPKNLGKGAAVRTGFAAASGEYVVVQDADLEYDPRDLKRLFILAAQDGSPAVYGSRRLPLEGTSMQRGAWYYYLGGLGVTVFTNLLYGTHLTDEPTGYKMLRRELLGPLALSATGFEFCPELTAKLIRLNIPIREIAIRYSPRSRKQGKKIRFKDGVIALFTLLRYRFWHPHA